VQPSYTRYEPLGVTGRGYHRIYSVTEIVSMCTDIEYDRGLPEIERFE